MIYIATWDSSFVTLKRKLIEHQKTVKYNHFYILNPAKLSNRLALANFNIDASCISSDLFLYADQKYDISNKVKSLLDMIAPILGKKDHINNSLLMKLGYIRKQQLEDTREDMVLNVVSKCLPIEEALGEVMKYASNHQQNDLSQKLMIYMNDKSNVDCVIEGLNHISQDIQNHREPDLKSFFEPIEQLTLQVNE